MAKSRNTIAKRYRELEKKRKADEKRARRQKKKVQPNDRVPFNGLEGGTAHN